MGVELEHGETGVALPKRADRSERERVLASEGQRDHPLRGDLGHHRFELPEARLHVGRLHLDFREGRHADPERFQIELFVVELDLTRSL
jgi:hypothetical protein